MRKKLFIILICVSIITICLIQNTNVILAGETNIVVNGNDIATNNINGLTFKGFGVLSGNSSSALLMDYKAENPEKYLELLKILFGGPHPIMTHIKIEMGNDRNNSTGPDPATMRFENEEVNVARHPGFQLACDAKGINPNLKVSILRWSAPGWANTNTKIYTWYKKTIIAAFRTYGFMVDYVNPSPNEKAPDLNWTKTYSDLVKTDNVDFQNKQEQALYNKIKVIISDEAGLGSFGEEMVSDVSLRDAVAVAGYHYNTDDNSSGDFKKLAEVFDKEIWNSEAQATFSNSSFRPFNNKKDPTVAGTGIGGVGGPLEMSNTIIKGFVNSRRTHFIYQPAIGSFYEGGQYSFKELVSARDPWSGWIHYDAGLEILRHYSLFSKAGWEDNNNTSGIWRVLPKSSYTGATGTNPINGRNGSPSYMTLASPNKKNFSTVFTNDSEYNQTYYLTTSNMGFTSQPTLEKWETRSADSGKAFNSNYMKCVGNVVVDTKNIYTITVKPYSIVTVTTLSKNEIVDNHKPLPVEGSRTVLDTDIYGKQNVNDNILYADDFDYSNKYVRFISYGMITDSTPFIASRGGTKGVIPRYTSDRNGAFEAYLPEGSNNYVLRQQVDQSISGLGDTWNNGNPVTGIGDNRWLNYKTSVDVSFENNSVQGGKNYAAIGARQQGGSNSHYINGTPYILKYWFDGGWSFLVDGTSVASGNVATGTGGVIINGFKASYNKWHNIALKVTDNIIVAYLDGVKLTSYTDTKQRLSGRVDLASGYYYTRFDNLKIEKVDGYEPYYTELIDNMEMQDLTTQNPKLVYDGSWAHENGKSMYTYQRSLSTSQGTGATLKYSFTGTGFDILGLNDGTAKLEVTVDGNMVEKSANTNTSTEFYQTYTLRDLENAKHIVQIKVISGTLNVDAVGVISTQSENKNLGDVNNDGKITSTDIALIERHILGVTTLANGSFTTGDVDKNNKLTSTDIAIIGRYILGIISII